MQRNDALLEWMKDVNSLESELTEANIKKYLAQHNLTVYTKRDPRHFVECLICNRVYKHR